jgi:hypothetical protein
LNVEDEVLVNCLFGERPSALNAYVVSDLIASPDRNLTMRSFVRVVQSQTAARADFTNFNADRIKSCQDTMFDWENNPPDGVETIEGRKYGKAIPIAMPVDELKLTDGSTNSLGFRMIITPTDTFSTHQDIFAFGAGRYEVVLMVQGSVVPDVPVETQVFSKLKDRALSAARVS